LAIFGLITTVLATIQKLGQFFSTLSVTMIVFQLKVAISSPIKQDNKYKWQHHHIKSIDCSMARTASLDCLVSIVSGRYKNYPWKSKLQ
jgi:hypothetical protein